MNRKQKRVFCRIIASVAMMVALYFVPAGGMARLVLYMLPYLTAGYDILLKAGRGIINRQMFDENFLMSVATVGAIALAASGRGDYTEAVAVMVFYQTGELFQSYAVGKSRHSISELMDIRPDYANLEQDGQTVRLSPDEVPVGSVILVRPGERVPIDGVIIDGHSCLDTSALTGESQPRDVGPGMEAPSGCINLSGLIRIQTTRGFEESTASRILELVENAGARKARSEAFISRFARVYTPAVCFGALALAILPPLARMAYGAAPTWDTWMYRALTFLVISCPCALVVSIPLTFFAGIGGAGRGGILIKGANYIETLSRVRCAVLDKTGTLTQGSFAVSEVRPVDMDEGRLLKWAAIAESASTHPVAKGIIDAYGREITEHAEEIREMGGNGVTALVDGIAVAAGSARLMESLGITCQEVQDVGTAVHLAVNGKYAGYILLSDNLKPGARRAVENMRRAGVRDVIMLTGDGEQAAKSAARQLGIREYCAGLLPGGKVDKVEEILARVERGGTLLFAGDGINDAPVLSRADVGVAMGALGSDAAIEAADVVIMDDDPCKISIAIRHSRRCMAIVWQNIALAIGVKAVCLALGAIGRANMWAAIFADVGVMVLAVLNAMRALSVRGTAVRAG